MAGGTGHASLYSFDFCGVAFDSAVPHWRGKFQLRSYQGFVALFTDASWIAAEVSPNEVEWMCSLLWQRYQRVYSENVYCLCGPQGTWLMWQKLGWRHEACIQLSRASYSSWKWWSHTYMAWTPSISPAPRLSRLPWNSLLSFILRISRYCTMYMYLCVFPSQHKWPGSFCRWF